MISKIARKVKELLNVPARIDGLKPVQTYDLKNPKVLNGRMLANFNNQFLKDVKRLSDAEFQVYSQWGDDGIIQWLIYKTGLSSKTFVEFGVQNYTESNTRFLVVNNNWEGLVMDGSAEDVAYIKNDPICNLHHLHAKCVFITKENINSLLSDLPFDGELGILSVDIDGNDYWVWKEINVVNPVIVISEYNAHFKLNTWTVPYKSDFVRAPEGHKKNYWGVSLQSLCDLAEEKGYYFVGCNSAGNNAYFVRKDKIGDIKPLTAEEGYEFAKFRETKDHNGEWISDKQRLRTINDMEVFNTRTRSIEKINVS